METKRFLQLINYSSADSGPDEIYDAINTYDMAETVRAATSVLKKAKRVHPAIIDSKSKTQSIDLRKKGVKHYKAGRKRDALILYNKALAIAPNDSEEMMLAYGNRSAVMFNIRHFTACRLDINTCLAMGCPKELAMKLKKRSIATLPYLHEELKQRTARNIDINYLFDFECKRNADVPSASADVAFKGDGSKRVTAGKDIRVGAVVAIERAFVTCVTDNNTFTTCYYCNRMALRLHPCTGCCIALFCDSKCRDLCMKEYHRVECQVVDSLLMLRVYDEPASKLMTRSAIKMSLKLGWDALITASTEIGTSRMRTATVRQTYNSDEPLSMLSYDDNKYLMEGRMFNGSVICAVILEYLDRVPDYFPKDTAKRAAAKEAMSRIMLHLYVTFTNKIPIRCSSYDFNSKSFKHDVLTSYGWFSMSSKLKHSCEPNLMVLGLNDSVGLVALRTIKKGEELTISFIKSFKHDVLTSYGWFSMSSKLKHSCEPNLMVLGLNDSVGLVALRTIKKGEELTISFIEHFYDSTVNRSQVHSRATRLFRETQLASACRVCKEDWDESSDVDINMTDRQNALFNKLTQNCNEGGERSIRNLCTALDVFPLRSMQHMSAYSAFKYMTGLVQISKTNNKTYL